MSEEFLAINHIQRKLNTVNAVHGAVLDVAQVAGQSAKLLVANPNSAAAQTIAGPVTVTGNTGLPAQVAGSMYWAGGYANSVAGRLIIGDGSGWKIGFSKQIGSVTTDIGTLDDSGNLTLSGSIAAASLSTTGNVTVAGNLTVQGTTTTISSNTVNFTDRILHVNDSTGTVGVPTLISGLAVHRGNDGTTDREHAGVVWDESTQAWTLAFTATNNSGYGTGGHIALVAKQVTVDAAPTTTNQVANKGYVDAAVASVGGSTQLLGSNNAWTGTNSWSNTSTFTGPVNISGTSTISGPLNVASTATTTISGPLNASGTSTFTGPINASGTTTISGPLNVASTATTTISGPLNASGTSTFTGPLNASGTSTFTGPVNASGTSTFTGPLNVASTATTTISGPLNTSGTNTFTGPINASGTNTFTGPINASGTSTFTGPINASGTNTISGPLNVSGISTFTNAVNIQGNPASLQLNSTFIYATQAAPTVLNIGGSTTTPLATFNTTTDTVTFPSTSTVNLPSNTTIGGSPAGSGSSQLGALVALTATSPNVYTVPYSGLGEIVWVGGVVQVKGSDYTVSGTTLTFSPGLPSPTPEVLATAIVTGGVTASGANGTFAEIGPGNGTNTTFTLPGSGQQEIVFTNHNYLAQRGTQAGGAASGDYYVSGTSIVFFTAPANGVSVKASCAVGAVSGTDAQTLQSHAASYFLAATAQAVDSAGLSGHPATYFLPATAQAVDSAGLQGHPATYFLPATAQAVDSAGLQGHPASYFQVAGTVAPVNPFMRIIVEGDLSQVPSTQLPLMLNPFMNSGGTRTISKICIYCPNSGSGSISLDILGQQLPGSTNSSLYATNAGSKPVLTGNGGFAYLVLTGAQLPSTLSIPDLMAIIPELLTAPTNTWTDLVVEIY